VWLQKRNKKDHYLYHILSSKKRNGGADLNKGKTKFDFATDKPVSPIRATKSKQKKAGLLSHQELVAKAGGKAVARHAPDL